VPSRRQRDEGIPPTPSHRLWRHVLDGEIAELQIDLPSEWPVLPGAKRAALQGLTD
jgi:hypothetical protein